jgi:hypothetical protein
VGAEVAPDLPLIELLVEPGLPHSPIISDGFSVVNPGLREPMIRRKNRRSAHALMGTAVPEPENDVF